MLKCSNVHLSSVKDSFRGGSSGNWDLMKDDDIIDSKIWKWQQTWKMSNFLHGWKFQSKFLPQKHVNFRQNQFFDKARKSSFLIIYSVSRWKTLAVEWHWWLYLQLPQPSGHFRVCLVCQCGEVPSSPAKDPIQGSFIRQLLYVLSGNLRWKSSLIWFDINSQLKYG